MTSNQQPNDQGLLCEIGHHCTGTDEKIPCPENMYRDNTGGRSETDCNLCPAGKQCLSEGIGDSIEDLAECDIGFYCDAENGTPQETCESFEYSICDQAGMTQPRPCMDGSVKNGNLDECIDCLAGELCKTSYDGAENAIAITPCNAGFYCEAGSGRIGTPCPDSTTSVAENGVDDSICNACVGGAFCAGLGQTTETGVCDAGYWCSFGVNTPRPEDLRDIDDPQLMLGNRCDVGHSCTTVLESECPLGTYQPDYRKSDCLPCPAGYNCDELGISDLTDHLCPDGSYCIEGTGDTIAPEPCPIGTYSISEGLEKREDCIDCPAGKFCDIDGNVVGDCQAGFYCSGGSSTDTPCQAGMTCDGTNSAPNDPDFQIETCWDNPDVDATAEVGGICIPGYYCPAGAARPNPCEPGKFCSSYNLGANDNDSDGECQEGFYCPAGSTQSDQIICPRGHYCPGSSPRPAPCPPGTFTDSTGLAEAGDCDVTSETSAPGLACEGQSLK